MMGKKSEMLTFSLIILAKHNKPCKKPLQLLVVEMLTCVAIKKIEWLRNGQGHENKVNDDQC